MIVKTPHRLTLAIVAVAAFSPDVRANSIQNSEPPHETPEFDVASVKVLGNVIPGQRYGDLSTPGRVHYRTTIRHLIKVAYSAEPDPTSEPNWFGSSL